MAGSHRYIAMLTTVLLWLAPNAFARPVFVQVEGGETAFVVDIEAEEASWVLDDCHRPLPVKSVKGSLLESGTLSDTVDLGERRVELEQRFRFDVSDVPRAEIYNSVRGGWAPVPVRVEATCHQSADCRARMELPRCAAD